MNKFQQTCCNNQFNFVNLQNVCATTEGASHCSVEICNKLLHFSKSEDSSNRMSTKFVPFYTRINFMNIITSKQFKFVILIIFETYKAETAK